MVENELHVQTSCNSVIYGNKREAALLKVGSEMHETRPPNQKERQAVM